jgi:glucose/arabinose dehydrogenase
MSLKSLIRTVLCCAPLCFAADLATAATLPAGFTETQIAGGLTAPTAMAFSPDGRLFVAEQTGKLRVIKNNVLLATPFVSLTVSSSGERGLLGVAFDPAFASNQYVYVYYTATSPNIHNRVSRFTANGDVSLPGSELVLLDLERLSADTNHNGGAIHFGADGKLYVAVGDNAVGSNAQILSNRLGKMLRINADGTIPSDNPFFSTAFGDNRAIWAMGLRNPFTFAVEPVSGALFINDVGANAWEEINEGVAGANYGWPDTEGPTSDPRFRAPLYAYTHSDGCAIAGGTFHSLRWPNFPFRYWGAYFFADLCSGWIRARRSNGIVVDFASGISQPVDLDMADDGSLYYLARGSGAVFRIAYAQTPRIDFTANGSDGPVSVASGGPLQIDLTFDAGSAGSLPSAEVYVGLFTPSGLLWLDPVQGFRPQLTRLHSGRLADFGPSNLFTSPGGGTLGAGGYLWLVLVDEQIDGVPAGDISDFVFTSVR